MKRERRKNQQVERELQSGDGFGGEIGGTCDYQFIKFNYKIRLKSKIKDFLSLRF